MNPVPAGSGGGGGGPDFAWILFALGVVLTLAVGVLFVWLLARGGHGGGDDRA